MPLALQILYYPVVDGGDPPPAQFRFPSLKEFSGRFEGDYLTSDDLPHIAERYLEPSSMHDPRCAVLRADLTGVAPAVVITAEVDPLRDEGKAYTDKLLATGVVTHFRCFEGTFHPFMSFPVPQRAEAIEISVAALRIAFGLGCRDAGLGNTTSCQESLPRTGNDLVYPWPGSMCTKSAAEQVLPL